MSRSLSDPVSCLADPVSGAVRAAAAAGIGQDRRNVGCGLEFLAALPEASVACAVFDPQYRGVMDRLAYGNEGARQKGRARLAQMPEATIGAFLSAIARVVRPRGHLFLWVDKFHLVQGVRPWLAPAGLEAVDMVTWDKGRIGMGYRTRRRSEYLVVAQKPPLRAKGVWTRRDIPDVVTEKVPRAGHAHRKPVELQASLIEAVTDPGDLVIDPAAGSFSVLESCARLGGRVFLGTDLADHAASS